MQSVVKQIIIYLLLPIATCIFYSYYIAAASKLISPEKCKYFVE